MSATLESPTPPTTLKAYLKPIDSEGTGSFAARAAPTRLTRHQQQGPHRDAGVYRSLSYVGKHAVVVDAAAPVWRRHRTGPW
jgi:hypothetical protein